LRNSEKGPFDDEGASRFFADNGDEPKNISAARQRRPTMDKVVGRCCRNALIFFYPDNEHLVGGIESVESDAQPAYHRRK
jgi:hypothetical protein